MEHDATCKKIPNLEVRCRRILTPESSKKFWASGENWTELPSEFYPLSCWRRYGEQGHQSLRSHHNIFFFLYSGHEHHFGVLITASTWVMAWYKYMLWFNFNFGLFCTFRRKTLKDTGLLLRFQVVRYNYAISQQEIEKLERSLCFLLLLFHLKVAGSCS